MKIKDKSEYRVFPHITVSIWLHCAFLIFFIICMILLGKEQGEIYKIIMIILAVVYPVIFIGMALLLNVFFWNAAVKINAEGMFSRRGLHIVAWKWDEIADIKCRTHRPWPLNTSAASMYSPKITFISSKHNKKCSIVMERYTKAVFFKICPNENIKEKCMQLLESCDFVYLK